MRILPVLKQFLEMMTYLYTARAKFDKENGGEILTWTNYIEWSKLSQLTELVSMDACLNEVLVEPDRTSEEDWKEIVIDDHYETGLKHIAYCYKNAFSCHPKSESQ